MSWKLDPHPTFPGVKGPVVVCIMDGVGIGRGDASDAVATARTPNLDRLRAETPTTSLAAHGLAAGMPSDEDMGNSEVGHNHLGAGRIFCQGASLVAEAVASGSLFEDEVWKALVAREAETGEPLHWIGLLSDGNVHSHIDHLAAMLRRADADGVQRARVHILLDGRDVYETSALDYVDPLEALLAELRENGRDYCIASGGGRMLVTMDRYEADWSIVERGWKAHVRGEARAFPSTREAIETFRKEKPRISDQNLPAFVIADESGQPVGAIRDGAGVIFFNFRGDRAIEISRAFEEEDFDAFPRGPRPDVLFAGMMQYDGDLELPGRFLVAPPAIDRTLGEFLARNGASQLAISETQKFGHVTYFWNGNRSSRFDDTSETWVEIRSDTLPFEERPWMKAAEITDRLIEELRSGQHRHARVNYANGDMVGHTGLFEAAVIAVEAVDLQVGRLLPVIDELEGAIIVTSDHGNADVMFDVDAEGEPIRDSEGRIKVRTSHTLNRVPCSIQVSGRRLALRDGLENPGLANVAATVLHLLGYAAPDAYEPSLLAD
jgi:2,3-bisphosphoglycerate-independent phosphoglycerate mutase